MRAYLGTALAIAAVAATAGCPAAAPGPQIVLSSASPGAASSTVPSPLASVAASAQPSPSPAGTPRPLGPGPVGGTLADVARELGEPVKDQYRIRFETTQGDFVVTLFPERAKLASQKFLALCNEKFYEQTTFHRVVPGFVAQGGDHLSKTLPPTDPSIGTGQYGDPVPDDFRNGLKHLPGALAYAHSSAPNSSYSQFYIALQRVAFLDGGYTVFGQVIAGWDTVQKLTFTYDASSRPTGATPDRILKVTVSE